MWLILFSLAPSPLSNLTNSIDLFLLFPMLSIDKCKQFAIEASLPSIAKFEPHRQNQRICSWGQPSLKSKFLTRGKYSNLLSIKNLSTCYYFLYIALSLSLSLSTSIGLPPSCSSHHYRYFLSKRMQYFARTSWALSFWCLLCCLLLLPFC